MLDLKITDEKKMDKKKGNVKLTLRIMSLAWAYVVMFLLPYVQYVFYIPLQEALGVSNEQLGRLLSMYAIACIVAYIPGGWLADRFNLKKILLLSAGVNTILCAVVAVKLTYPIALVVWLLSALTSGFAFWAALIKGIGLTGEDNEKGKVWGRYELFTSIFGFILATVNLQIFNIVEKTMGIKGVFAAFAIYSIIAVILIKFCYYETETEKAITDVPKGEATKLSDLKKVICRPAIWFVTIAICSNYIVFAGMTYFTPYLSDVLGLAVVTSGLLVVVRSYGMRMLAGPVYGYLVDKTKVTSLILMAGMILTAILIGAVKVIPATSSILIIVVFFVASFTLLGARGLIFNTLEEIKIDNKFRGMTVALVCMLAYSPDLFIYQVFGRWLDNYGEQGYQIIFTFLIAMCLVSAASLYLVHRFRGDMSGKEKQVS